MTIPNGRVVLPVRNPYTGEVERINAGTVSLQDTFLTLFKTWDIGTNSFADSGLGGDRTGPAAILRFLRKKALLTQSAPPAPLARPTIPDIDKLVRKENA